MDKSKPKIIAIDDYKKSQGFLERPYGECGCGGGSFGLILSDWSDDAFVWGLRCYSCDEVVELEPPMIITCELDTLL